MQKAAYSRLREQQVQRSWGPSELHDESWFAVPVQVLPRVYILPGFVILDFTSLGN